MVVALWLGIFAVLSAAGANDYHGARSFCASIMTEQDA